MNKVWNSNYRGRPGLWNLGFPICKGLVASRAGPFPWAACWASWPGARWEEGCGSLRGGICWEWFWWISRSLSRSLVLFLCSASNVSKRFLRPGTALRWLKECVCWDIMKSIEFALWEEVLLRTASKFLFYYSLYSAAVTRQHASHMQGLAAINQNHPFKKKSYILIIKPEIIESSVPKHSTSVKTQWVTPLCSCHVPETRALNRLPWEMPTQSYIIMWYQQV